MKNIDFLPEIYRQRAELRKARIWWGVVVVVFSVAIGSSALSQWALRRSIEQEITLIQPKSAEAKQHVLRLGEMQLQLRKAGEMAGLVTYLEHPWPRTQILAQLVRSMPADVQVTQLSVTEEELVAAATEEVAPRRRGSRRTEETAKKRPPAVEDLEQLRGEHDRRQTIVEMRGQVQNISLLHDYVASLGRSPLIAQAQIKSLEVAPGDLPNPPTQFMLRVIVRPGYGQPGAADEKKQVELQPTAARGLPRVEQGDQLR